MSVRHALLALLSEGPKYGLQLRNEFEGKTGDVWPLNVGQVYSTLQRLERDELVAAVHRDAPPVQRVDRPGAPELGGLVRDRGDLRLVKNERGAGLIVQLAREAEVQQALQAADTVMP